jgi:protein ImuA
MQGGPEKVAALRRSLARQSTDDRPRVALGHDAADAALMGGLRLGALHEVYAAAPGDGGAATGFATALAARASLNANASWLFWIRQDYSALEYGELHGAGLAELGLDPSHVLILKVADVADGLKAAGNGLACRGLSTVVIETIGEAKVLDLTASRRLALAAAAKGVTAIVLRLNAEPEPSAAETRWIVRAGTSPPLGEQKSDDWGAPIWIAALARNRHGACGQWAMEWCGDDRIFREHEAGPAHRVAVAAAAFDRPDRTPPTWERWAG